MGSIEAEDYFAASQVQKKENRGGGFRLTEIDHGDFLIYTNIHGLENKTEIVFRAEVLQKVRVEMRQDSHEGELLASYRLNGQKDKGASDEYSFDFPPQEGPANLCFVFRGNKEKLLIFDSFSFR